MLKFLIIVGVIVYVIYKVGSFFFRAGAASQNLRDFQQKQNKGFQANTAQSTAKKSKKFNGGEYIDYEEVK